MRGMHQHFAAVRLLNEVIQHALGDFEIGNYAVFHGLDGDDVAGRAAEHFLGLFADSFYLARVLVDGDDGGFVNDDTLSLGVNKRVGRAQIDGKVGGKQTKKRA